jgi:hypothetical protein
MNPINGGSPPSDSIDLNSNNLVVASLFTVIVWLRNDMLNDLVIVVTVNVSKEYTAKYIVHKFNPASRAASIQPVWLIDEYVKIFRSDVWFIPPTDPIITDIMMITRVAGFIFIR